MNRVVKWVSKVGQCLWWAVAAIILYLYEVIFGLYYTL